MNEFIVRIARYETDKKMRISSSEIVVAPSNREQAFWPKPPTRNDDSKRARPDEHFR